MSSTIQQQQQQRPEYGWGRERDDRHALSYSTKMKRRAQVRFSRPETFALATHIQGIVPLGPTRWLSCGLALVISGTVCDCPLRRFFESFLCFFCVWNPWPPVKWQGRIVINPVIYSAVSLELRGIQLPTVLLHKKPSLRVRFWNFKQFTIFCGLVKNSCFGVEIVD